MRPLHILIGNARRDGLPAQLQPPTGWEMQIGTNHFGHYRLGVGLAGALEKGGREQGPDRRDWLCRCRRSATGAAG